MRDCVIQVLKSHAIVISVLVEEVAVLVTSVVVQGAARRVENTHGETLLQGGRVNLVQGAAVVVLSPRVFHEGGPQAALCALYK